MLLSDYKYVSTTTKCLPQTRHHACHSLCYSWYDILVVLEAITDYDNEIYLTENKALEFIHLLAKLESYLLAILWNERRE